MGLENGCGRLIELRKRMSTYAIHFSYIYVKGPGNKKIWLDLIKLRSNGIFHVNHV